MPRPAKTPQQRANDVRAAHAALGALIDRAAATTDPEAARKAWEAVEVHGATIHRQSRLLAGKSKGG